jgi:hypothetical protein
MLELFPTVIASAAKQSRSCNPVEVLDCRAALAMTGLTASTFHQAQFGNDEARNHA